MKRVRKPLFELTARDLMSEDVLMVPRNMSLRAASHLLSECDVSGAPVVDETGRCAGVISSTDFMRWTGYDNRHVTGPGHTRPHDLHSAWQVVDAPDLISDEVGDFMTKDIVTVAPETPLAKLARAMTDAHIHRIVVVDENEHPIGVVTSTDILAAVAYAEPAGVCPNH
jgi:CBS domain-containing protein